ncbi:MAG: phosphate-selective porin OprO/OprP [Pseudohongiellaceae bacterium]|jgi:phosphate-selective porin OprO/OprP
MKQTLLTLAVAASVSAVNAGTLQTSGEDLFISTNGGIKVHNADKSKTFQLGGRLQWDYDATESSDAGVDTEDLDVRRARIYVKGKMGDWAYKAQFNVAESDGAKGGNAEDLYIRYTGFGKSANVTVGKQKEPFGLEGLTSSKVGPMLERSAVTEFYTPGRSAGIQVHGAGSNWTYGVGYFEADGDGSNDIDQSAITARATFLPINTDDLLVHVGAGFSMRDADNSNDEADLYNVEVAAVMGAFHAQAEYFEAEFGDVDADGYYLQAGWVITGETRPYKKGAFGLIKPASESGAWEIVIRHEDGDGKYKDIGLNSGNGEQTSYGINYYANNNVRLGLSYMDGESEGEDGDELRARLQLVF